MFLHRLNVPMTSRPPHGPIVCYLFFQTKVFHVIVHTFQPWLSWPTLTSTAIHLKIHTFLYPLMAVITCSLQRCQAKPPKSATRLTKSDTQSIPSLLPSEPPFDRWFFRETPHIRRIIFHGLSFFSTSACSQPSLPRSHCHTSSHFAHRLCVDLPLYP